MRFLKSKYFFTQSFLHDFDNDSFQLIEKDNNFSKNKDFLMNFFLILFFHFIFILYIPMTALFLAYESDSISLVSLVIVLKVTIIAILAFMVFVLIHQIIYVFSDKKIVVSVQMFLEIIPHALVFPKRQFEIEVANHESTIILKNFRYWKLEMNYIGISDRIKSISYQRDTITHKRNLIIAFNCGNPGKIKFKGNFRVGDYLII